MPRSGRPKSIPQKKIVCVTLDDSDEDEKEEVITLITKTEEDSKGNDEASPESEAAAPVPSTEKLTSSPTENGGTNGFSEVDGTETTKRKNDSTEEGEESTTNEKKMKLDETTEASNEVENPISTTD